MKKALICGGHGFIGHHLARHLKRLGYWVRTVDINDYVYGDLDVDDYVIGDLCDAETCNWVTRDPDGKPFHECYQLAACYDDQTEILSEDGWKLFKDLKNEKVATRTREGVLEWNKPTQHISYRYKGEMIHVTGRSTDLLVTPNHRMFVKRPFRKDFELLEARQCKKVHYRYCNRSGWIGVETDRFTIKTDKKYRKETFKKFDFQMDEFLEFLGYYLSEGSTCSKKNRTFVIHLANKDPVLIEKMFRVCQKLGYNPYRDRSTSMGVSFCSQVMLDYLFQFGLAPDKFIPTKIKNLSKRQLSILFNALMSGDGNSDGRAYNTTSKRLAGDIQEIALKIGYGTTLHKRPPANERCLTKYEVLLSKKRRDIIIINRPHSENYEGVVYCVNVKNHVVMVRRNGKTAWCGNCMGGAGMIFTGDHDAEVMHDSGLINLNMAEACRKNKTGQIFWSSSACAYNHLLQQDPNNPGLKEDMIYPAFPDSPYGWEKICSEIMWQAYARNYDMDVRIARFHNVFGSEGSWDNGKEKSPAAVCHKVAQAKDRDEIEIWGDGEQTRSFLYIDECLEGIRRLMDSDFCGPVNIGSDEIISINGLVEMVKGIAGKPNIRIKHVPGPLGVRGRTSDNTLIKEKLGWAPTQPLRVGMEKLYAWIEEQVRLGIKDSKA